VESLLRCYRDEAFIRNAMPADCKSGLGSGAKRGVLEWEQIRWRLNEVERFTLERSYIGGYVYWVSLIEGRYKFTANFLIILKVKNGKRGPKLLYY